jgi:Flp pilus assembly protein CpaB
MELEYVPPRRRGRVIVLLGIILAGAAGIGAFVVVNNAQQAASNATVTRVAVVVAARNIPARKTIDQADLALREVAVDSIPAGGALADPAVAVGHIAAITILPGQAVTSTMFASTTGSGTVAVLGPDETIAPNSPAWRAVAINVPDDRALGGLLAPGQNVDIFITVPVSITADTAAAEKYVTDRSTKITYQDVPIIAKNTTFYVIRVTQQVAEEIAHFQASGSAAFSLALRPDIDTRVTNTAGLGETTNLLIQRYGIPVPEAFPNSTSKITNPVPGSPAPLPYAAIASPEPSPSAAASK